MTSALSGLSGLSGINAISQSDPFATPEQRMGGPVNPYHGTQWGEQAKPYSWESQQTPAGSHGPYGLENQLLGDDMWFIEPAGMPEDNPQFSHNTPDLTRSHGSVNNRIPNTVQSQADSIRTQLAQLDNHGLSDGTSLKMVTNRQGDANYGTWNEIWEVNDGSSDLPQVGRQFSHVAYGFGVNDAASNTARKANQFGYGAKHMHRRWANSPLPGNFMWMRPRGRPLFKTIAGPARPPIGGNSPFAGQDLGDAFAYDTGAVLLATPEEYIPPPAPNIQTRTPTYDNPYGTDATEWW
jgi:hypothetical protein